ncbi:MAG TPA: hypothetical protein PKD53_03715 [Chloroflexaceae bacterium]|nr:hypothetical protein [Chloroflexaceae bacterium]
MPIVFVHGAGTREYYRKYRADIDHVVGHLRHYVAPAIAADPGKVEIIVAYWGDLGVELRADGLSVPLAPPPVFRDHPLMALWPAGRRRHILAEVWRRLTAGLGYYLGRIVAVMRRPQTKLTAMFLGDALHYFVQRGSAERPGPIPLRVLEALARGRDAQARRPGEPLVVFSHSLGGAIVYDVVTHFLPAMPRYHDIHIDFWASVSSQVGLLEEMQLFLASDPRYGPGVAAPFPDRRFLANWWNVWDPHDFLSFTVRGVIDGVDDEHFDSGLAITAAHLACLRISSFYAVLGRKVAAALGGPVGR